MHKNKTIIALEHKYMNNPVYKIIIIDKYQPMYQFIYTRTKGLEYSY